MTRPTRNTLFDNKFFNNFNNLTSMARRAGGAAAACAAVASLSACAANQPPVVHIPVVEIKQGDHPTKVVGEGRLEHAPQYFELSISVNAECYPTPVAASRAADQAVGSLMKSLRPLIDSNNPKDGVFSRGGFTQPFYRRTRHGATVCEGTFQKVSSITVKSSRIDSFSGDYAKLQRAVLTGTLKQPLDPGDQSTTHATLSTPTPQLYFETRERLEQQALADAIDNARAKLAATAKAGCRTAKPKLLKFEESNQLDGRPIPYAGTKRQRVRDSGSVAFDAIWVNKLVDVYFKIPPGAC